DGDELVDVVVTKKGDELLLATAKGMAIRFAESDARPMGRNTSGVKGIRLTAGDSLVGMVVADPDATLLTATENGFGKRTPFGANAPVGSIPVLADDISDSALPAMNGAAEEESPEDEANSGFRYRTQN